MCEEQKVLETRSYHISQSPRVLKSVLLSKSDLNFLPTSSNISQNTKDAYPGKFFFQTDANGEYYKKYEHDEVPVKDSDTNYGISRGKGSLTNSDLDNLEKRVYNNVSQELQTDESSFSSLDSNIKFFKTTVEKIFDNFFNCMSDFELYKKRFNEIIGKSKEGSVDDMEDFIKDMFDHIMSAENSVSSMAKAKVTVPNTDNKDIGISRCGDTINIESELLCKGFVEAYKNENYLTDSTLDDNLSKLKKTSQIEEIFNIFLLGGSVPCVEIKLTGRNLLSEIQIKDPSDTVTTDTTASADDLKRLAAKQLQLEKYIGQAHDCNAPDRNIPVKISFAKKNIHLNEDFAEISENSESSKSFLVNICNLLCRKFRKSTVG